MQQKGGVKFYLNEYSHVGYQMEGLDQNCLLCKFNATLGFKCQYHTKANSLT